MSEFTSIFHVACKCVDGRNYIAFLDADNKMQVMKNAPNNLLCVELSDGRRVAMHEDIAHGHDYIFLSCAAFVQSKDGQISIHGTEAGQQKEYGPVRYFYEDNFDEPTVEVAPYQSKIHRAPAP